MAILTVETTQNTFDELGKELWERLRLPVSNVTYWTHLVMGVCFYGAIGVWTEVLRRFVLDAEASNANILLAMHSTYPAIIGATAMQLLLRKEQKSYLRSFAQLVSTIFFLLAAVCILAAAKWTEQTSFELALFGNLCAVIFWWIANARDEGLQDRLDSKDSVGGELPELGPELVPTSGAAVKTAMGAVKL